MRRALPFLLVCALACDDEASGTAPPDAAQDAATTPMLRLEAATLHVNTAYESLGFRVSGEVGAADVVALHVVLTGETGEVIPLTDDEGGGFRLPFDRVSQRDGRFSGRAGFQAFGVEVVAGARILVVDADQARSEAVEVTAEPPGAPPDGDCDPIRAVDACPAGQLCTRRGCEPDDPRCPDEWAARPLMAGGDGVRDDTSGATPLAVGSCGGGASSHVFEFTAPVAGAWLFDLVSDGHPDTLLFVRRSCAVPDVAAELGCNDDATDGDLLHSAVVGTLDAGETVYVFVDGYSVEGATGGGYRLTVRNVTAPVIDVGEGFVNPGGRAVGVRLEGADPDHDVEVGWMVFADAEGVAVGTDEPFDLAFTELDFDAGRFAGTLAVEFLEAFEGFDAITQVLVFVSDAAGLVSDPVVLQLEDAPALESGATCHVVAGFGSCPEAERCANLAAPDDAPVCQAPVAGCPDGWVVENLHAQPDWTATGDTTDGRNHGAFATCGGGGPNAVFRFVAPESGTYAFSVDAADEADTVLYARSLCGFSQGEYELACNDDRDEGTLHSAVELDLEASGTVFLFVDGYASQSVGVFTLVGRAVER